MKEEERKEDGNKFPLSLSPYFNAYKYLRPIRRTLAARAREREGPGSWKTDARRETRERGGKNNIFDLLWQSLIPSVSYVWVAPLSLPLVACALRSVTLGGCLSEIFLPSKEVFGVFYRRNRTGPKREPREILIDVRTVRAALLSPPVLCGKRFDSNDRPSRSLLLTCKVLLLQNKHFHRTRTTESRQQEM